MKHMGNRMNSKLLQFVVLFCLSVLSSSCGKHEDSKNKALTFGHSFNVIVDQSRGQYLLNGYSEYLNSESQAFAPQAVLIVGLKDGLKLGGEQFVFGSVVLVEGTNGQTVFRLARVSDRIELQYDRTNILGKAYLKGPFPVPENGILKSP